MKLSQPSGAIIRSFFKPFIFSLLLAMPTITLAQDEVAWPEPSIESQNYTKYRATISKPPFGLAKVQALISNLRNDEMALNAKKYQALSMREQFTYNMIYGEIDDQSCDAQPEILDEQKKIFSRLPDFFGDSGWGPRQLKFFVAHRDTVLKLIKESTLRSNHMGANYKQVIVDLKANAMIPFVIEVYRANPKDKDLLTVLLLLMSEGKYVPFLQSSGYKKLYGDENDYRTYLEFNVANEQLIISRAMAFYNASKH